MMATLPNFIPPRVVLLTAPPRVGNWYLVPAICRENRWLPVRGPAHQDDRIGLHLHYDRRFISRRMRDSIGLPLPHRAGGLAAVALAAETTGRPFQCVEPDHDFPDVRFSGAPQLPVDAIVCKSGRIICPHQGADLTDVPVARDGFIHCPLHGARIIRPVAA